MFFRLLDWVERDTRKKQDRIIVFKNMFNIDDFEVCVASEHDFFHITFPALGTTYLHVFPPLAPFT